MKGPLKSPQSFHQYLALQESREDEVGRFARYWTPIPAKKKPRICGAWPTLAAFLEERNEKPEMIQAARKAWQEWKVVP